MIVTCERGCGASFDDAYRTTLCPHDTFAANSWTPDHPVNAFQHHPESHLSGGTHAPCPACPVEVRGLYAVAFHLLNLRADPDRWTRKLEERLDELQVAVDRMTPLLDAHFGDVHEARG